jgi:hypothetical protein
MIKLLRKILLIMYCVMLMATLVNAQFVGHSATQILPGVFPSGNYIFTTLNATNIYKSGVEVATLDDLSGATNVSVTSSQTVRNNEAFVIEVLTPVKFDGYNIGAGIFDVVEADASISGDHADCIMAETVSAGNSGLCVTSGTIEGIDTTAYNELDDLYLNVTAGTLTTSRPSTALCVQRVAQVLRDNAVNGVVWVNGAGRCNDIPNDLNVTYNVTAQNFFGFLNASYVLNNPWLEDSQESSLNVSSCNLWDGLNTPADITGLNSTNIDDIYVFNTGDSITGSLNMTDNNITNVDRISFGGGYIYDNGTALILGR